MYDVKLVAINFKDTPCTSGRCKFEYISEMRGRPQMGKCFL